MPGVGSLNSSVTTSSVLQKSLQPSCSDSRRCQPGEAASSRQPEQSQDAGTAGRVLPAAGLVLAPLLLWKSCCFMVTAQKQGLQHSSQVGEEKELIQLGDTIDEEGSKAKRHMKNLKSRRQQYFQGFMWH